jgi:hypothetical protein
VAAHSVCRRPIDQLFERVADACLNGMVDMERAQTEGLDGGLRGSLGDNP